MEQLEVFIEVEEPRDPIDYEAHAALVEVPSVTIGEFYTTISNAIRRLPSDAFAPSPRNQIRPNLMFGSITVTDVDSAIAAIDTIIEQGEGTTTSPEEIDGPDGKNDFAHYYRLMELRKGRRLVRVPGAAQELNYYEYSGDPLAFDPSGVDDLPVDPAAKKYPVDSDQRRLNDEFNFIYTALVTTLDDLVNDHNDMPTFMSALKMMSTIEDQARIMASGSQSSGIPVGPSFEYQPRDPAGR